MSLGRAGDLILMEECGCGPVGMGSRRFGAGAGSSKHGQRYMPMARAALFSVRMHGFLWGRIIPIVGAKLCSTAYPKHPNAVTGGANAAV